MSLVGFVALAAVFIYVLFFLSVFVFDEAYPFLTELCWYASIPAFWLGYGPLIGILIVLEKTGIWVDNGPGDTAHLFFFVFGTPIGWSVIIGGTWLVQYLIGNYDIIPTQ